TAEAAQAGKAVEAGKETTEAAEADSSGKDSPVIGVWPLYDRAGYGMEAPSVLSGAAVSWKKPSSRAAGGNRFVRVGEELSAEVLEAFLRNLRIAVRDAQKKTGAVLALFAQKEHMPLWGIDPAAEFDGRINLDGILDLLVGCYLVNPLKSDYEIEDIASEYPGITLQNRKQLFGKKTWAGALGDDPDAAMAYACRAAQALCAAAPLVRDKLREQGMWELYTRMERPLTYILYDMERIGIRIDPEALQEYSASLGGRIDELEQRIYEETGETFNIASPKQLGEILFGKMGLPGGKKTKTGYSTAAGVLEKLAPDYPVVNDILAYRGLTKLRSTYADGLMAYVADDRRIHTTLKQTITATGRISSTDPNLQNIPMKTELGRQIRKAFIPREGFTFTDADYSQIELRILAHMSADPGLIEAYRENEDIHRITASRVFHTPFDEVTPLQRRNAKAVNFGIVYGISSFGLSQGLSISRQEAAEYIKAYFKTYPGIKVFLDGLVSSAKKNGYASTMYGRRRPVPELSSSNFMQRSFGERVAMNSPIQGSAADIMKIAMIRVWERILREKCRSQLILQIHDELLIETAPGEEDLVRSILEEEMGRAAELSVRLETDVHSGTDWYVAK
ncbi:MAG: DNA polymerase I, partial [Eubacteriales bacterium]|nr:DNA polymerase I [Eubacteriales bacterium]